MGRNDNKTSNKNQKKAPKDATAAASKVVSDYQAGKKSKSSDLDSRKK
ncbi:hypothetical protein [Albibacterium sp.]|nr:hypothetical protein [Albibacterium sp.]HLT41625.1 hypothetical protein [Sphingobacteriaceae bacterium]HUH18707.1 hypothetical protein [Albibacterium sp.]